MGIVDNSYPAIKVKPYQDFMIRITISTTKPSNSEGDVESAPVKLVTCLSTYQRSASDALSEAIAFMGEAQDFLVQVYPMRTAIPLPDSPATARGNVMWTGESVGGMPSQTLNATPVEPQTSLLSFSSRLAHARDYMRNSLKRLINKA